MVISVRNHVLATGRRPVRRRTRACSPASMFLCVGLGVFPGAAHAELVGLPDNARLAAEQAEPLARPVLATGPWSSGAVPSLGVRGAVTREAWQIGGSDLSTEQILAPLQEGFAAEGFRPVFDCTDTACGGFEFRYALDLLPEPAMHVDLGDFRYLLLERGEEARAEYVALLISRSGRRDFVHVTTLRPAAAAPVQGAGALLAPLADPGARIEDLVATAGAKETGPDAITRTLSDTGRVVLGDLRFATGSSQLAQSRFGSLDELAGWMQSNPEKRIVLVGHTDNDGTLAANMDLSRRRAQAVRETLRKEYGIDGSRMDAEGVGFLAPLESNASEAGRTRNRRVEAVLEEDAAAAPSQR